MSDDFDPDAYLKAEASFNPDAFLEPQPVQVSGARRESKDPGVLRTIGSSLLQGFFKNGSDEAAGGLTRLLVDPGNGAAWRQPDGSTRPLKTKGDVYRAGRDAERETLRGASEHHPKTAFAAGMLGDIASDGVAKLFGLPAGTTPYNVATGALSGFLGSDADLTPDKATPANGLSSAASTGLGAALGYVMPKVGERLGSLTPRALRALRRVANNAAVSQGRRVLLNGADSLSNRVPVAAEAVLEAIDSGAIVPGGTTQGAFARLERLADQRGAAYGAILEELERQGVKGPEAEALAKQLAERGDELLANTGADKAVPNVWLNEAANLESLSREPAAVSTAARLRQLLLGVDMPAPPATDGRLGLNQAEQIKRALQASAKYGRFEETPVNEAKREVASRVRQAIEDTVEQAGRDAPAGSDVAHLAEGFVPVKQTLARTLEARNAAERGASRVAQRRGISLSDYVAAGMGSGITDKVTLGTVNNLLRTRGTSTFATGARGLANLSGRGAHLAAAFPERVIASGGEAGASMARVSAPALARLLGLEDDTPDDETAAALIEALRARSNEQPSAAP